MVVVCQGREAAAGLELKCIIIKEMGVQDARNGVAYLLFGPGQLAFKLLLLVEQSLVLSTQHRETLGKLISELRDILGRLIPHGCVSQEQRWCCGGES